MTTGRDDGIPLHCALTACNTPWPWYPSITTGDPPLRMQEQPYRPQTPSIQEQMGTDPISKLAAAIEKLADALREGVGG